MHITPSTRDRLIFITLVGMLFTVDLQHVNAQYRSLREINVNFLKLGVNDTAAKVPSPVTGLKVVAYDKYYHRIILSWFANPASEKVDSYAIYSQDPFKPGDLGRELNAVTRGTSVSLATWSSGSIGKQPPHSVVMQLGYFSDFWVIGHNKYGWAETVGGPYPSHSLPPKLNRQQQIADYPNVVSQDWACTTSIKGSYPGQCP